MVIKKYVKIFVITLLLILLARADKQCTVVCQPMSHYVCKICYCQQTQKFINCTYYQCPYYQCYVYEYILHQLQSNQCFGKCCDEQMKEDKFSVEAIGKCREQNQKYNNIAVGIFFGVFGFVVLVVALCIFFGRRRRNLYQNNNNDNSGGGVISSLNELAPKLQWTRIPVQELAFDAHQTCTICFIEGVEVQTVCKHGFHLQCLKNWLSSSGTSTCPNCVRENIQTVKYFCKKCCSQFVQVNLKNNDNVSKFRSEFEGSSCPDCY